MFVAPGARQVARTGRPAAVGVVGVGSLPMTKADPDALDAAFEADMVVLRQHYVAGLPARGAALAEAWAACADAGDEAPWQRLRDVAHKLAGSASSYGFEALGQTARELDRLLSGRAPSRSRAAVAALVTNLTAGLAAAVAKA